MIREYAPIGLIPAAWVLTFATIIYPGISTYWIQNMHYFMIVFLAGFTVLSWKEMESDPVLDIWRKVIAAGTVFTLFGAVSFTVSAYSGILGFASLTYWLLAPGIALYYTSKYMDNYSILYGRLGTISIIFFTFFISSVYLDVVGLQILGVIGIAVVQTISILKASKLDSLE